MPLRNIILTVLTVAVVGALVLLFAEASENPEADIPEQALERARQRHERAQARPQPSAKAPAQPGAMKSWKSPQKIAENDEEQDDVQRPDTSMLSRASNLRDDIKNAERPTLRVPERSRLGARPDDGEDAELQNQMRDVNRLYDRRDYEGALAEAKRILAEKPGNVRMLRVVVSSACIMGDHAEASKHYELLPPRHQQQMERRCSHYGMSFESESK